MLLARWLDVPDAMAFLDAFAEAAEKTRGWKLESIKFDYGYQFVYVRYTGRKFAGRGWKASAFAPVHQYHDREGAVLAHVDAPTYASPNRIPRANSRCAVAGAGRSIAEGKARPLACARGSVLAIPW